MSEYVCFPYVEVSGDPRERGRQYGEQAAEQVAAAADLYGKSLRKLHVGVDVIRNLADEFLDLIKTFDAKHADEVVGISEGAGVPLQDVVTINARRELVAMAKRYQDVPSDECTAAVVLPEASRDGVLMHGQNWDAGLEHVKHCVVLRIQRDDGPDILTFTEAGALARNGFNDAGIAITGNNIECDRDFKTTGVPLPMIRRKALEEPYYALSINAVYSTPKAGSSNMMLSQQDGDAINIECAPDESFLLYPEDGILTHANHWESVAALTKLRDTGATRDSGLAASPCSAYRGRRLRRLLHADHGQLTLDDLRRGLLDKWQSPYSICRPPRPAVKGDYTACTSATVLMRPAEGVMEIARVPSQDARFTRYSLYGAAPAEVVEKVAA